MDVLKINARLETRQNQTKEIQMIFNVNGLKEFIYCLLSLFTNQRQNKHDDSGKQYVCSLSDSDIIFSM